VNPRRNHRAAWGAASTLTVANTAIYLASSQGSLSVLYSYLASDFGWSRAALGSIGSVILFVSGLLGLVAGLAVDRFGTRSVVLCGAFAVACGCALAANAQTLLFFYAFALCLAVAQPACGFVPAQVVASRRFRVRRGLAMGLATAGLNVGGVLGPLVTNALAEGSSWRGAYLVYAGFAIVILPLIWWQLREPPQAMPVAAPAGPPLGTILRSGDFWLPTLAFAAMLYAVIAVAQHWVLMNTGRGMPAGDAALLLTVYYAVGIAGRFVFGPLYDRYPPARVGTVQGILMTALILMLLIPDTRVVPGIYAVLFGLCYGGFLFLSSLILGQRYADSAHLGTVIGAMASVAALLYSTAPAAAGWLYDLSGRDTAPILLAAGMAALATVLIAASARRR
jgi:OFA family oxalate/formate antiporter-like MFS transporter